MGLLDDVLAAVVVGCKDALMASGIQNKTYEIVIDEGLSSQKVETFQLAKGQVLPAQGPLISELVDILSKDPGQWQVTVFPVGKARPSTRFSPKDSPTVTPPTRTLFAHVANGVITFSGSIGSAPYYVHSVINRNGGAYVATSPGQTLAQLATAVAAAINGLSLLGVSAAASGATVVVAGAGRLFCNVVGGGNSVIAYEGARFTRDVQVDVWASDPITRSEISSAIVQSGLGSTLNDHLALADGSDLYIDLAGDAWNDNSQSSHSLYRAAICFDVEYPVLVTRSAAISQVGVFKNVLVSANNALTTAYVGG